MAAPKRTMTALSSLPQKRSKLDIGDQDVEHDSGWDHEALIAAAQEAEEEASNPASLQASKKNSSLTTANGGNIAAPSTSTQASRSQSSLALMTPSDPLALERTTMDPVWFSALENEMSQPYFRDLKAFLASEASSGQTFYPPLPLIHSWSRLTPLNTVKIVILGQDPYHGPGQAQGMSFSVPKYVAVPGSLRNIYKELSDEYSSGPHKFTAPKHGNLEGWAKQGVLLNESLTV